MYANYQIQTANALVQVEFPVNALSEKHKFPMQKFEKNAKFKMLSFCQEIIFSVSNILMQNVQCFKIVYAKYQMSAAKALVQVEFPVFVLSPYEEEKWKNCYVQNAVILSKN